MQITHPFPSTAFPCRTCHEHDSVFTDSQFGCVTGIRHASVPVQYLVLRYKSHALQITNHKKRKPVETTDAVSSIGAKFMGLTHIHLSPSPVTHCFHLF